jgi:hypothetical protein
MVINVEILGDKNIVKKTAEYIPKFKDLTTAQVEGKNKSDTSNNSGNLNHQQNHSGNIQ